MTMKDGKGAVNSVWRIETTRARQLTQLGILWTWTESRGILRELYKMLQDQLASLEAYHCPVWGWGS